MSAHVTPHFGENPGTVPGLCWCPCGDCTLRLTLHCICPDCPCDEQSDHDGTGKEQVPREVLERAGWLPRAAPESH